MYCVTMTTEGSFLISVSRGPTTRIVLRNGLLIAYKNVSKKLILNDQFSLRLTKSIAPF